jgi:hypothetical protein
MTPVGGSARERGYAFAGPVNYGAVLRGVVGDSSAIGSPNGTRYPLRAPRPRNRAAPGRVGRRAGERAAPRWPEGLAGSRSVAGRPRPLRAAPPVHLAARRAETPAGHDQRGLRVRVHVPAAVPLPGGVQSGRAGSARTAAGPVGTGRVPVRPRGQSGDPPTVDDAPRERNPVSRPVKGRGLCCLIPPRAPPQSEGRRPLLAPGTRTAPVEPSPPAHRSRSPRGRPLLLSYALTAHVRRTLFFRLGTRRPFFSAIPPSGPIDAPARRLSWPVCRAALPCRCIPDPAGRATRAARRRTAPRPTQKSPTDPMWSDNGRGPEHGLQTGPGVGPRKRIPRRTASSARGGHETR